MKPAPFTYLAPTSLDEALQYLREYGFDAKLLAGGQSLIPTMNFRLAQPAVLVDLNTLDDLTSIRVTTEGGIRVGAMSRQREVEVSQVVADRQPLLSATMPHIAHVQIRNRGTIGGSLAHADPAAELPAVAVALDARMHSRSATSERWVAAGDFFTGLFATALADDEILTEIVFPPMPPTGGWGFREIARRKGDYALVGVAVVVSLDDDGRCESSRIVLLSVGDGPTTATQASQLLNGERPSRELIHEAAHVAAQEDIDPPGDIHATIAYRRHLAEVVVGQALVDAYMCAGIEL